jgi:CspA family cold shock protein
VPQGTVKWFNAEKGYGFIVPAAGEKDLFVHVTGLVQGIRSLSDGQTVEFQVREGRKGPEAVEVRPV